MTDFNMHQAILDKIFFYQDKYKINNLEFCNLSGISTSFFFKVRKMQNSPSLDFLARSADVFNLALIDFLDFSDSTIVKKKDDFIKYNLLIESNTPVTELYSHIAQHSTRQDYSICYKKSSPNINSIIDEYSLTLATNLKLYFSNNKITLLEFSNATGISIPYLNNLTASKRLPSVRTLNLIHKECKNINLLFFNTNIDLIYYPNFKRALISLPTNLDTFVNLHKSVI